MSLLTGGSGSGGGGGGGTVIARKITSKNIVNSVAETDLFNGEITIAGGALSATSKMVVVAYGDCIQNTAGITASPRLKLKLGATVIFDTGAAANGWQNNGSRWSWWIEADVQNIATNSQVSRIKGELAPLGGGSIGPGFTVGEGIVDCPGLSHTVYINGFNSTAVDTTAGQALVLSVILPVADPACEYKLFTALVTSV